MKANKFQNVHEVEPIRSGEVHLWSASLDENREALNFYESLLNQTELCRAAKYVFPRDQAHFVVCRGILRDLLGAYLSVPAEAVEIVNSEGGKPTLGKNGGLADLRFNVSHSNGFAVFAFSIGLELGVDAEFIKPEIAAEEIATRYFSEAELKELTNLQPQERAMGFFRCWTRKEAYVKARGKGFEIPLNSFSVTLSPGAPARLASDDSNRWSLHSLELEPGWASAMVVEGIPARIAINKYVLVTNQIARKSM